MSLAARANEIQHRAWKLQYYNNNMSTRVSADQFHMTVSSVQVYNSLRWCTVFLSSYHAVISFQLITGPGPFSEEEFSLLSAYLYIQIWMTWEIHFLKDHSRASLLALAKFVY